MTVEIEYSLDCLVVEKVLFVFKVYMASSGDDNVMDAVKNDAAETRTALSRKEFNRNRKIVVRNVPGITVEVTNNYYINLLKMSSATDIIGILFCLLALAGCTSLTDMQTDREMDEATVTLVTIAGIADARVARWYMQNTGRIFLNHTLLWCMGKFQTAKSYLLIPGTNPNTNPNPITANLRKL